MVIRAPKTDTTAAATNAAASSTSSTAPSNPQASANRPDTAQANAGGFPFGLGLTQGMGNLNFAN